MEELGPSQRIWNRIPAIIFNSLFHEVGIGRAEEPFSLCLVGKVNYDEPGGDGNELSKKSFNDLLR